MRGRLIQPFLAELARLDTAATAAAGGYDADFRSVKRSYPGGVRASARVEKPAIRLRCQVEDSTWENQRQQASGNVPDSRITLIFHFADLERLALVDPATGDALLRVDDRLVGIYDERTGALVQKVRADVPMYATEVRPIAFGIGRRRNLLLVNFDERPQGLTNGT